MLMQTVNNEIVVENFADTQETIVREFTVQELEQREIDRLAYEQQEAERLGVSVSELIRAMLFRKRRPRGVSLGGFERQEPKALL